ncbi:unnamed protein product [Cochlearia groenlandica]
MLKSFASDVVQTISLLNSHGNQIKSSFLYRYRERSIVVSCDSWFVIASCIVLISSSSSCPSLSPTPSLAVSNPLESSPPENFASIVAAEEECDGSAFTFDQRHCSEIFAREESTVEINRGSRLQKNNQFQDVSIKTVSL